MTKKECEKILNFDLKVLEEASFDYPQCKASKNDYIELSSLLTNNRTQMMLLDPNKDDLSSVAAWQTLSTGESGSQRSLSRTSYLSSSKA